MSCLGNIIWLCCGGFIGGLGWISAGIIWCISIIGIPVGIQCFKIAILSFCPFGRDIVDTGGVGSCLMNILWLIFGGFFIGCHHLFWGILLCITVIGIPFGMQHLKLARLAFMPFGVEIL